MKRIAYIIVLLCACSCAHALPDFNPPDYWLSEYYVRATPAQIKTFAGGTKDDVAVMLFGSGATWDQLTNRCTIQVMQNLETVQVSEDGATTNTIAAGTDTLVTCTTVDGVAQHRMRLRSSRLNAENEFIVNDVPRLHVEYHLDPRDRVNLLRGDPATKQGTIFDYRWDAPVIVVPKETE